MSAKENITEPAGYPAAFITLDQFAQLMGAVTISQAWLDAKFTEFGTELYHQQEEEAVKVLKRVRYEKPYVFAKEAMRNKWASRPKLMRFLPKWRVIYQTSQSPQEPHWLSSALMRTSKQVGQY